MTLLLAPVLIAQLVSSHRSTPAAAPTAAGGVQWTVPKTWTVSAKGSSMRVATYDAPRVTGDPEDPEIAVFYFGEGQGGSVESNVMRWISQLEPEGKQVS